MKGVNFAISASTWPNLSRNSLFWIHFVRPIYSNKRRIRSEMSTTTRTSRTRGNYCFERSASCASVFTSNLWLKRRRELCNNEEIARRLELRQTLMRTEVFHGHKWWSSQHRALQRVWSNLASVPTVQNWRTNSAGWQSWDFCFGSSVMIKTFRLDGHWTCAYVSEGAFSWICDRQWREVPEPDWTHLGPAWNFCASTGNAIWLQDTHSWQRVDQGFCTFWCLTWDNDEMILTGFSKGEAFAREAGRTSSGGEITCTDWNSRAHTRSLCSEVGWCKEMYREADGACGKLLAGSL